MTGIDYSDVGPGTRTDILVAELVMGWTPWLDVRGDGYTHVVWQKLGEKEPWKDTRPEYQQSERYTRITGADIDSGKHINHLQHFAPTRDWQAFGDLMERLMAEDAYVKVEAWREDADDYVVEVEYHMATANDLRLAVVRAALMWATEKGKIG